MSGFLVVSILVLGLAIWILIRLIITPEFRAVRGVRARLEMEGINAHSDLISPLVFAAFEKAKSDCSGDQDLYSSILGVQLASIIIVISFWANGTSDDIAAVGIENRALFEKHLGKFSKTA